MSGGSFDYFYNRIEEFASEVDSRATRPIHKAFANHLRKVAQAAHDLEWVFSADSVKGDEDAAILAVVGKLGLANAAIVELRRVIQEGQTVLNELKEKK